MKYCHESTPDTPMSVSKETIKNNTENDMLCIIRVDSVYISLNTNTCFLIELGSITKFTYEWVCFFNV